MKTGKIWRYWVAIVCLLFAHSAAWAFVDPPTFEPAVPDSSQPITVSVRNGVCHYFLAPGPGIPPLRIEYAPGIVDIIAPGSIAIDIAFCFPDIETNTFEIGALPAGNYQVRVWFDSETCEYIGAISPCLVASAPLTVGQAAPQPIPTFGTGATLTLIALVLLFALPVLAKRRRSWLFLAAVFAGAASAQDNEKTLLVLLSAAPDAPTVEALVEPITFSAGYLGDLSAGFTAEAPVRAYYLLPKRASGDFAVWLEANPDDARAKLERYIVVTYPESANLQTALAALNADSNVLYASIPEAEEFATPAAKTLPLLPLRPRTQAKQSMGAPTQAWISDFGFADAWSVAGGYGLVATLDTGLNTSHPDLIAFDGSGAYTGGNFLPVYAYDVGRSTSASLEFDFDVDERQPVIATNAVCDPDGDSFMVATYAGHGTHVAGLIAANASNGDATVGACKHCGIAPWRIAKDECRPSGLVRLGIASATPIAAALTYASDIGVQVINQSFGFFTDEVNRCATASADDARCLAITKAHQRGVLMVGASGNNRQGINFPAEDSRVVAVGGLEPDLSFWNDRLDLSPALRVGECPNTALFAPSFPIGSECGSNFTAAGVGERRQEVTVAARDVYSTIYPNVTWNATVECGDDYGDASGSDGRGACTGTSMSAPLYSGLAGLLRSINPLVMPGDPENMVDAIGIRDVVVESAQVPGGANWNAQYGYGVPHAGIAARSVLGSVGGNYVKNRLTPLFSMYSTGATDWAQVTVPQAAIALAIYQAATYNSQGTDIPSYLAFPESPFVVPLPPLPRANAYVLTTEFAPGADYPELLPLYWLDRVRNTPLGCVGGAGCNTLSRDFLLLTTVEHLETAHADGYAFRGLQGYVYAPCSPEPGCIPEGAEKLYRQCHIAEDDCGIFLASERAMRQSEGYTEAYPAGSDQHIGYAYPNIDSDGDGLIDGFEHIIGTRADLADSDNDGVVDGNEFPLAGISLSDPCEGPNPLCNPDVLFSGGFESY